MKLWFRKAFFGVVAVALLFGGARSASATSITYLATVDHCGSGCGSTPMLSINLNDFGATGAVLVTATLFNGNKFVNTGAGLDNTFDFNLVGNPTISVTGLTAGFSLASTTAGTHQMDGFGDFDYSIIWNTSGGGSGYGGVLSFTVNVAGLTVGSFAELSNASGANKMFFSADIASGQTGNTGPVGAVDVCTTCTPPPTVPEPASLILMGTGLVIGAKGFRRKISKK